MTKTAKILISVFAAGALAIAVGFVFKYKNDVHHYKLAYELSYRRALTELVGSVAHIDSNLSKSIYAQSPSMIVTIATDIYRHAEAAKNALAVLPTSDVSLEKTAVFVSQVGDFSLSLARSAARGEEITAESRANLVSLNETAAQVAAELDEIYLHSDAEGFFDVSAGEALTAEAERVSGFSDGITAMEGNLPESPVLIYDGPYSEHITQTVPQYLQESSEVIDAVDARRVAARFLGVSADSLHLSCKTTDPVIYTYENDEVIASVTAVGAHVISYSQSIVPAAETVAHEDAVGFAQNFLIARGYADMEPSYYYASGGILYVNFAYVDRGVTVYPDLIQVGVALDSGKVTYFQADGYWNNHRERTDLTPTLSLAEAQDKLSASFTLQSEGRLCIIPSPGKHEILCYEFRTTGENGKHYLCYINAHSGIEETIFVLIEDENGVLTI